MLVQIRMRPEYGDGSGYKINVVKTLREASRELHPSGETRAVMGLKEAVDCYHGLCLGELIEFDFPSQEHYDELMRSGFFCVDWETAPYFPRYVGRAVCEVSHPQFTSATSKIQSIKNIRHALGYGLKEAKDVVDEMHLTGRPVRLHLNKKEIDNLREYGMMVVEPYYAVFEEDLFTI